MASDGLPALLPNNDALGTATSGTYKLKRTLYKMSEHVLLFVNNLMQQVYESISTLATSYQKSSLVL